jgi:lipopolysaccharide assembly outer membrane protein LptD (OstA)
MRYLASLGLIAFCSLAAQEMRREGSFLLLKGKVEITTDLVTIWADEARYSWDTGEVETRGNRAFRIHPNRSIEPKN